MGTMAASAPLADVRRLKRGPISGLSATDPVADTAALAQSRHMKAVAIILTGAWVCGVFPMMLLGALWSGSLPLWPPEQSPLLVDKLDWGAMFFASYGLPVLIVILFLLHRRKAVR